jgi:hypothetical protein
MDSLPPIPTPLAQRWREFRIEILPLIVFVSTLVAIALMWRSYLLRPDSTIEVEAVKANSTSPQNDVAIEPMRSARKAIVGSLL